jgi:hypothetical protein
MTTTVSAPCMEHEIDHGLDTRVCNRRPLFERLRQILSESRLDERAAHRELTANVVSMGNQARASTQLVERQNA